MDRYILQQLGLPADYNEFQKYKTLYQIIENGQNTIQFLQENKDLDFKGFFAASNGESLTYLLAKYNFFNAINFLIEHGYDFQNDRDYKTYNEDGSCTTYSALYAAAQKGHTTTIEALLGTGYNLKEDTGYKRYDKDGKPIEEESILYAAAKAGKTEIIKSLLDAGYDLN